MKRLLLLTFLFSTLHASAQKKDTLAVKLVSFTFNKTDSSLGWTVTGNTTGEKFIIQQFRWNAWRNLDTFSLDPKRTSYSYKPYIHGGRNQYRIICGKNKPKIAEFCCGEEANFDGVCHLGADPRLTKVVLWEILNENGKVVRSGRSKVIPTTSLPKGVYYLNYDNKLGKFVKK